MYADSGILKTSGDKEKLIMILYNGNRYQQILNDPKDYKRRPMASFAFEKQKIIFDLSGFKIKRTNEDLFRNNAEMMNVRQLNDYVDTIKFEKEKLSLSTYINYSIYFNSKAVSVSRKTDSLNLAFISINEYITRLNPEKRTQLFENALIQARSCDSYLEEKKNEFKGRSDEESKFKVNWHKKFTLSFACFVLFFVGAPLGAIVRKGGLGLPVVISIVLFIIYHVISFTAEKMALEGKMEPFLAMWLGSFIFLPFGIWLSVKAAKDSSLFDAGNYFNVLKRIFRFKKK
jgi:lipopolysaccharide export system permease protein